MAVSEVTCPLARKFQMAEVAVPKRLSRSILDRIRRLRLPEIRFGRHHGPEPAGYLRHPADTTVADAGIDDRIVSKAEGPGAPGSASVHPGHRRSREAKSRVKESKDR